MELQIGGQTFKVQKLSGYRLLKVFGDGNKDPADLYRDLILACVEEPKLTKEQVEEMNAATFLKLGAEITKLHASDLENFQNIANLSKK
ncbi:hypothetical protein DRP04_11405 [Archaeoglobales archaeon]|nr:MAG: hypothetical protein DRP04_11405 [Archaeoglobales archaeon]